MKSTKSMKSMKSIRSIKSISTVQKYIRKKYITVIKLESVQYSAIVRISTAYIAIVTNNTVCTVIQLKKVH